MCRFIRERAAVACFAVVLASGARAEAPPAALKAEVEAQAEAEAPPAASTSTSTSEEEQRLLDAALATDAAARAPATAPDVAQAPPVASAAAAAAAALQSMNPDLSVILDAAAAAFSVDRPLQAGGHDPRESGFNLQQLELAIGASVDPLLRFDSNIVFAQFGVEVEEAYATTLALPFNLQVRAGQFLTRFGRVNPTHVHSWHFVDQVLAVGKLFGSEGNRGLGAELSWLLPTPWYAEVLVSTTNADGACCARSYLGGDDIGVKSPLDLVTTGALKQFFPLDDDWSLLVGASAQTGPNATGNMNRTEVVGVDAYLRLRPRASTTRWALSLETEAMLRSRQVPFGVLRDGGGYAQVIWQIDQSWETGARYELMAGVDNDPLDPSWTSWRHRVAGQVTWHPSHFSRLRMQGSVDIPTWEPAPIYAAIAAVEVVVGAHGAHAY